MNEKIPINGNDGFWETDNNDQVALLLMHKAWKDAFGNENSNKENMQETQEGRE